MDTRAMKGVDIASDHQFVRSKIKLKLKRKQKNKVIRKKCTLLSYSNQALKHNSRGSCATNMIYYKTTTKQTKKKLRKNCRTLRMHTKKQLKKYWGTNRKGKNHGAAMSRGS